MTGMKSTKRNIKRVAVSKGSHMLSRSRGSILADMEQSDSDGEKMVGLMRCGGGHGIRVGDEKIDVEVGFEFGAKYRVRPPAKGISHRCRGRIAR